MKIIENNNSWFSYIYDLHPKFNEEQAINAKTFFNSTIMIGVCEEDGLPFATMTIIKNSE